MTRKKSMSTSTKITLTAILSYFGIILGVCFYAYLLYYDVELWLASVSIIVLPALIPLLWIKRKARKIYLYAYLSFVLIFAILLGVTFGIQKYEESITIDTTPSINVDEYMPFDKDSKIVQFESKTFKLTDNLPKVDGAAAVFPVYSSFVNAVYPSTTEYDDGVFEYNNTSYGYQLLAEKKTDIFFGAYPSEEQINFARECSTTFKYTPIGSDAFVFFVHKDNPIDSLTTEQIKGIYSGKITNWSEVGGVDEEIVAFQRNEGSGSQSMLERFMDDTPLMDAPSEQVVGGMGGIIEEVSDYRSKPSSIGFSFRYYIEGIIKNPDIKNIAIDGVSPTTDNIRNNKYPITTPLYAVTYEENKNENVDKLIDWILSDEGQYIIEETGYVGISE